MSATATRLEPAPPAFSLASRIVFLMKLTVQIVFGCLFLLDSLFFVLSYVTFDFFGAHNSPFFAWLRDLSFMMQALYFPVLLAALLCIGVGEGKDLARRMAFWFVIAQVTAGGALILFQNEAGLYGWALLFGPGLQKITGYIDPYTQAIAGLIPLAWISAIQAGISLRSGRQQTASSAPGLQSFLGAGLAVFFLYEVAARMRLGPADLPFAWSAVGFSLISHLAIFTLLFAALQWIRLAAMRFSKPDVAQFAFRAAGCWLVLAILFRKIIFTLLSFNSLRADVYAVLFSLTAVLSAAAVALRLKEYRTATGAAEGVAAPRTKSWARAAGAVAIAAGVFYLFAVKLVAVDWEHVLSSVAALTVAGAVLWFFLMLPSRGRRYGAVSLSFLSLLAIAILAGLQAMASSRAVLASDLEDYADYNPSFFAIQQALKPALRDGEYGGWYKFLSQHANMRLPVPAPDVPLTQDLKRTSIHKPNIFIFVIDALRRDYVSAYNPSVTFTPSFGAFAQDSVVFQHAYSGYAGTELAVPAILSGMQQINKTFPEPVRRLNHLQDMLNVDGYDCYTSFNPIVAALASPSDQITNLSADMVGDDQQDFRLIAAKLEEAIQRRKDRSRPIFVYSQPANVHTLYLNWHPGRVNITPHPGFNDEYASAVQQVDASFGEFVAFLKERGLYDDSIIIVTADHGEGLGEMGRRGHVNNLTPEVIQIPLIIHLPNSLQSARHWDANALASLHDITPTLYSLLGHGPLRQGEMIGRSLFARAKDPLAPPPDHYFLMSSYMPIFGILTGDRKGLFYADAVLDRSFYYDLEHDPHAYKKRMTIPIRDHYAAMIRQNLAAIDEFYGLTEQQIAQSAPGQR